MNIKSVSIKLSRQAHDDLTEPTDDFSTQRLLDQHLRDPIAMHNLRLVLYAADERDIHRKSDHEILRIARKKLKAGQLKVQKNKTPCSSPLFKFSDLFVKMAKDERLDTQPEFLMALALQESGWDLQHVYETNPSSGGKPLNNLFGLTNAGGNNLPFASVEASAEYFIEKWGSYLKGSKTIEEFVSKLIGTPGHQWNDHPNYPISILGGFYVEDDKKAHIKKGDHTIGTYHSVLKWLKNCGKTLQPTAPAGKARASVRTAVV